MTTINMLDTRLGDVLSRQSSFDGLVFPWQELVFVVAGKLEKTVVTLQLFCDVTKTFVFVAHPAYENVTDTFRPGRRR